MPIKFWNAPEPPPGELFRQGVGIWLPVNKQEGCQDIVGDRVAYFLELEKLVSAQVMQSCRRQVP